MMSRTGGAFGGSKGRRKEGERRSGEQRGRGVAGVGYILVCSQGKGCKKGRQEGRLLLGFSFNKTEYLIRNKCSRGKNGEIEEGLG